ncbi:MAG TPA: hypothetical protein VMV77_03450 [Bacteroidales bacterium]|nr:hypothetical protein [Bacteroidales bacterium]
MRKISISEAENMRIRDLLEYFEMHETELPDAQLAFISSLKKEFRWKGGLTETQSKRLFGIRKFLAPDEELIIRNF